MLGRVCHQDWAARCPTLYNCLMAHPVVTRVLFATALAQATVACGESGSIGDETTGVHSLAVNGSGLEPTLAELAHSPAVPLDADDVVVTARVASDVSSVQQVTLTYRIDFGAEVSVGMLDDGAHGDGAAGDSVFGARIPSSASHSGQMVRYFVVAADSTGQTRREPSFSEPTTTPEYQGTVIGDSIAAPTLPELLWFVEDPAAAETDLGTRSSVFFGGEFYDNVLVRIRGNTSRGYPKKSFKIKFNSGFHFQFSPAAARVDEINLNTTYTDKSYNRAVLAYQSLRDAGVPAPETFHVRVEQNGAFYSVSLLTEQIEADFLARWGLNRKGDLYKAGSGSTYDDVGPFEPKGKVGPDPAALQVLLMNLGLEQEQLELFLFDHVNVPAMVNYMAGMALIQNIDGSDKNHFLFRDHQGTGEWRMLPYDLDLTFGPEALNTDTIVHNAQNVSALACASHPFIGARPYLLHEGKYNRFLESIVNVPRTRAMLLRRLRSLTDAQLGNPSYFATKIDALANLIGPAVAEDKLAWGGDAAFGGESYELAVANERIKKEYLEPRLDFLRGSTIADVGAANPEAQPPAPKIDFGTVSVPSSTDAGAEYVTLKNPNDFAVDLSGWSVTGDMSWTLHAGTVLPAGETLYLVPNVAAFRDRVSSPKGGEGHFVQGNTQGLLAQSGGSLSLSAPGSIVVATTTYGAGPGAGEPPSQAGAGGGGEPSAGGTQAQAGTHGGPTSGPRPGAGSSSCSLAAQRTRPSGAWLVLALLGLAHAGRRRA